MIVTIDLGSEMTQQRVTELTVLYMLVASSKRPGGVPVKPEEAIEAQCFVSTVMAAVERGLKDKILQDAQPLDAGQKTR